MERLNEGARLVARSLELLKGYNGYDHKREVQLIADCMVLLEEALEKLTEKL